MMNVVSLFVTVHLDFHIPIYSVFITSKGVGSFLSHVEVCSIQHYVITLVSDSRQHREVVWLLDATLW